MLAATTRIELTVNPKFALASQSASVLRALKSSSAGSLDDGHGQARDKLVGVAPVAAAGDDYGWNLSFHERAP